MAAYNRESSDMGTTREQQHIIAEDCLLIGILSFYKMMRNNMRRSNWERFLFSCISLQNGIFLKKKKSFK